MTQAPIVQYLWPQYPDTGIQSLIYLYLNVVADQ